MWLWNDCKVNGCVVPEITIVNELDNMHNSAVYISLIVMEGFRIRKIKFTPEQVHLLDREKFHCLKKANIDLEMVQYVKGL